MELPQRDRLRSTFGTDVAGSAAFMVALSRGTFGGQLHVIQKVRQVPSVS